MEELLSPREVSQISLVPESTIRRQCQERVIKAFKEGKEWRIPRSEVAAIRNRNPGPSKFTDAGQVQYIQKNIEEIRLLTQKLNQNVEFLLDVVRSFEREAKNETQG